jgi:hypothetical protein
MSPQTNSLLIKKKCLGMSKHKFAFNKPTIPTTPTPCIELLEFKRIEKPKEVIKKTKPLNKNFEILDFLFENNNKSNNNNNNNNAQDIFNLNNI